MNNLFFTNDQNYNRNCPPSPKSPPKNPKRKKVDFKKLKKNTCNSLNEVECFLNDFKRFTNYIKLYKILK